jgi:peroxiredoxin
MSRLASLLVLITLCCVTSTLHADEVTLLLPGRTLTLPGSVEDGELWIAADKLPDINGFELKREGACRAELCYPLSRKSEDQLVRQQEGATWINLSRFAPIIDQVLAADPEHKVWSLGVVPSDLQAQFLQGQAPEFELKDVSGKNVKLSDFRGRKVLLLTWASWCGCSLDLPGWQKVYDDLKDQNFEIVAAAQDTGGNEAAAKFYDRAKATYTTLIDPDHTISSLYHMVNVPTGVWIDEQGHIVRPPEVAYSTSVRLGQIHVPGDEYVAALRDWVAKGADSPFILSGEELRQRLHPRDKNQELADAYFRLGVHFQQAGDTELAEKNWARSQELHPNSWNYHRQDWSFTPKQAMTNWLKKVRALEGRPYYEPLQLEKTAQAAPTAE